MIYAGIVAGGRGTRLRSADMPKQFLEIGGLPIIVRTIRAFAGVGMIGLIYVAVNQEWLGYTEELFSSHGIDPQRVKIIPGGAMRQDSIMNIISAIEKDKGIDKGDILLTHDAVRPFVSRRIIEDNISCASEKLSCGTYIPSEDTVVISEEGLTVDGGLDRSKLFRAQTPQSFELSHLKDCIGRLKSRGDDLGAMTDTCSIISACGKKVHIVLGDPMDFKITTDYDLAVARALCENSDK
ncbi:MAG: 2-C-methyl-D-erythritol 4-phosphate cytidylyltransferase [Ruminococcus sp.]|nr:2-C-methyl-D-erythritol 4-phosphate cytidylyltransferase [Ruminococcus sp.]